MSRRVRLFGAWLALCAMLMTAFAPSVSAALTLEQDRGAALALSDICSVAGPDRATAPAAPARQMPDNALAHFDHCAYCSLHADHPALPPAGVAPPLDAGATPAVPPLFLTAAVPLFAWRAAQPRAPPLSA